MLTDDQLNKIADHAFSNPTRPHRFNSEKYGPNMNINSASDLKRAIQKAADDPRSKVVERADGGYLIRQPSTNLSVIADGNGGGTVLRGKRGEKDFSNFVDQENKIRKERGLEPAKESSGPVPREVERGKEGQVDRPGETIGSASKPRDQAEVLKGAQDKQRETPEQKLTPEQRRAALQEASATVAKDQAQQKKAWEAETDPKKKEQMALKAGIEQADFKRQTARDNADLTAQEKGAQSIDASRARRAVKEADKEYDKGAAEWHKRSVRDSSYEPFDDKWSKEAERAKARESKSKDPQEKKDAALQRQFSAAAGLGRGHGM